MALVLNNMRNTIPISNVKVSPDRMRKDLGDLSGLAHSIQQHGLIQPIVLTPDHVLVAGERRFRACQQLNLETVDFVYVKDISVEEQAELEFQENFWRKAFTWQEEALGILDIYRKKKLAGMLGGFSESWQLVVAQMLGMSVGQVNYVLIVAAELEKEKGLEKSKQRYHNFSSVSDAYRNGILADKELEYNKAIIQAQNEAAKQNPPLPNTSTDEVDALLSGAPSQSGVSLSKLPTEVAEERFAEAKARYERNPLNVIPFDIYWKEKLEEDAKLQSNAANRVFLSRIAIQGNCITYMNDPANANRFDHIVTDPPYAIEMDNLDQANQGMVDIDSVRETHDVEDNLTLLRNFFPAAWKVTKEGAFVITFCDVSVWDFMYQEAVKAGFRVQRWPIIWKKVNQSFMNNAAGYNTTKDYEIIMVCRKPSATLFAKRSTSIIEGSNVEAKKVTSHPFAKPFEVSKNLIEMVSMEGQTLLEPFSGGGSIALQILRSNRNVVCLEKTDHHFRLLQDNLRADFLRRNPNSIFV